MATIKTAEAAKITVYVESGVTEAGKTKFSLRTITNIAPETSLDDRRLVGSMYGALQTYPVNKIVSSDTAVLVED